MRDYYTLVGLPSDILTSEHPGFRRLRYGRVFRFLGGPP